MADAPTITVQDASGRRVQVSSEDARAGYLTGQFKPVRERVRVSMGGKTATVDASEVRKAIDAGWTPISDAEHRQAKIRHEESSLGGQIRGTAEAAYSGITMGASDWAYVDMLKRQGKTEELERFRARRKAAGAAGDVARVAGEVLPVVLSGGAAATVKGGAALAKEGVKQTIKRGVGTGATLLGAAPVAVDAAGVAAKKGVQKLLGSGLKGRTAGAFAQGFVEGGASGLGEAVSEAALGDYELTGEQALASFGLSGLFGGVGNAAFPLAGAAIRKTGAVTKDGAAKVLAKATGGDPENLLGLGRVVAQGKDTKEGLAYLIGEGVKGAAERENLARVMHEPEKVIAESSAVIKQRAQSIGQIGDDIRKMTESDRGVAIAKQMGDVDVDTVRSVVEDELFARYERILGDEGLAYVAKHEGKPMHGHHLQNAAGMVSETFDAIGKAKKASDVYELTLELKRKLQRQVQEELGGLGNADLATKRFIGSVSRDVDKILQHDVFGKASVMHRELRDADRAALNALDAHVSVNRKTNQKQGKSALGRLMLGQATDRDAALFAKRLGNSEYADHVSAMKEYFDLQKKALETRAKYTTDPKVSAEIKRLRKEIDGFEAAVKAQTKNFDIADAVSSVKVPGVGGLQGFLALAGPFGAIVAGALLGGAPGAAVGALLNAAARPASIVKTVAALAHYADKAGVDVDRVIKSLTGARKVAKDAGKKASGARRRLESAARKSKKAARVAAVRGVGHAASSRAELQDQRARRASELSDPDILARELASEMYHIAKDAPEVSGSMMTKIALGAEFLASKMPPKTVDPLTGTSWDVDAAKRESFDRYYEAVVEPMSAIERLEDGTFTSEHAEALRVVWPRMYEKIQNQVLQELQEAADEGRKIGYQARASLGILLGIPTDVTMRPEFMARMREVHGGGQQAEAAGGPMPANVQDPNKKTRKTNFKAYEMGRTARQSIGETT